MAYEYFILPAIIFLARITDVSIGTIRVILLTRGARKLAPLLGFFEVLIWLIVVSQVMRNATNPACFIGYAAGFATGNFVGMFLEEKLAIGTVLIRVITPREGDELIQALNQKGHGATIVEASGATGHVHVILSVIRRSEIDTVVGLIQQYCPKAFYAVEDVRYAREGIFIAPEGQGRQAWWARWLSKRK
jgi:uncharacterized protein YebE (UPF0316 family)